MASTSAGDACGGGAHERDPPRGVAAYEIARVNRGEPPVPWPASGSQDDSAGFVTARIALMEMRGLSKKAATRLLHTRQCKECKCSMDQEHDGDCCCPCHCVCCCPPLFQCISNCECQCDCHYVPDESDEEEDTVEFASSVVGELVSETASSTESTPRNGTAGGRRGSAVDIGESKTDDESPSLDDERMEHEGVSCNGGDAKTTRGDDQSDDDAKIERRGDTSADNDAKMERGDDTSDDDDARMERGDDTSDDEDERVPNGNPGDGSSKKDTDDATTKPTAGAESLGTVSQRTVDFPLAQAEPGPTSAPAKPSELFQELVETIQRVDEESQEYGSRLLAELFEAAYHSTVKKGMSSTNETALPATTDVERELLYRYGCILIQTQKTGFQRFWSLLGSLALAATKSTWDFSKILKDRAAAATTPQVAPANVWTQRTQPTVAMPVGGPLQPQQLYVFDEQVYTTEEIARYREICEQPHVFAEKTRPPSPDEWAIMCGIMKGTILTRAMPQFLKRCCQLRQLTWFHQATILRAEGELWAPLPPLSKVYNYNQSSRRLIAELRQSAVHMGMDQERLKPLLDSVKAASYDKSRHALHLYFYTKAIAAQWEGEEVPFRKSKLILRNPDSSVETPTGTVTGDSDGLANDRYQAHYKLRLSNVARTLDLDRLAAYLQELTQDALQIAVPLDSYGPNSDWSLLWDMYSKTATCPPQLKDINRIMWDDHPIMVQHRPNVGYGACLLCAQLGHKMVACTVPEDERIGNTTLVVTASTISAIPTPRTVWATPEDALEIFMQLGDPIKQAGQSPSGLTEPTVAGNDGEKANGAVDGTSAGQRSPAGAEVNASGGTTTVPSAAEARNSAEPSTGEASAVASGTKPAGATKETGSRTGQGPWHMVGRRRPNKKKGKSKNKTAPGTAHSSPQLFRRGTSVVAAAAVDLTGVAGDGDSDEESDGDADEQAHASSGSAAPCSHTEPAASSKSSTGKPQAKRRGKRGVTGGDTAAHELQALEKAVKLARLEKFRLTLIDHMAQHEPRYSVDALTAAVDRSLGNILGTSSTAWVLEAINGRLAGTLGTGNCQYYGMAEMLHQLAMYKSADQMSLVETTILIKYGLWLASKVVEDDEDLRMNMAAILATPAGTAVDETREERLARTTKHFTELATSDSAVTTKLPEHLWGGWDTLRMFALLVNRPVFLISEHKSQHDVYLNVLTPQLAKNGTPTVAMLQPGTAEWLKMLREDGVTHDRAPLVLNYRDKHYDAVLLDRHAPTIVTTTTTRQTTLTSLVPSLPSLETLIETAKKGKTTEMTRQQVLEAGASLTRDDMTDFLANESWSVTVKKEIISLLVAGATNFHEVLTFSTESDGGDEATGSQASETSVEQAQPPSGSEYSMESDDDDADSTTATPAYSLPSQDGQTYREFADKMWEAVRDEWKTQHMQTIPALTDQEGLRKLAVAEPALMCELGRWCDHPLVLLDHFKPEWVKDWMELKRQQYLISRLTTVVDGIADTPARTFLHEWLQRLRESGDRLVVRVQIRDEMAWSALKSHASGILKGGAAGAFVTRDYSVKSAYVFVLDELLPDLARHVLTNMRGTVPAGPVSLADADQQSPALRAALDEAVGQESWGPVEAFMTQLQFHKGGAATHQY